jgi:hypothetical protein
LAGNLENSRKVVYKNNCENFAMSSALDVLEGLENDSGDDEEAMTAADVLQKLEEVNIMIIESASIIFVVCESIVNYLNCTQLFS